MFQPYRGQRREPGAPLTAMLRGRPGYLPNPQDSVRRTQRQAGKRPAVPPGRGLGAYLIRLYYGE